MRPDCRCGHRWDPHQHYSSAAEYCALCLCPGYRRPRRLGRWQIIRPRRYGPRPEATWTPPGWR